MSDQQPAPNSDQKSKSRRSPTGRPPHRWQPGESGNPRGRPRVGSALAERIREKFDPDLVIDLALRLAADETVSVERRLAALLPFAQLGYLRPPTGIVASIETGSAPARDWSAVPIEERRALLESIRRVPEIEPAS